MEFGLEPEDIAKIKAIFKADPFVDNAIIFGSRAVGNYKSGSDIDIAVVGDKLTFNNILELHAQLDDLGLLYKFDLYRFVSIKDPEVIAHIARVGKILYP
jgi:predicted nucleotidyltransferase